MEREYRKLTADYLPIWGGKQKNITEPYGVEQSKSSTPPPPPPIPLQTINNDRLLMHFFILGPRDMKSDGLTVKCRTNTIDISLSRLVYPWLQPEKFHISLVQLNCNTYNATDMIIRIQAPLFSCGTRTVRRNKFVLESRNVVIARVRRPKGFRVTYLPDVYFPFLCRHEITRSAGKPVFKLLGKLPSKKQSIPPTKTSIRI